MRSFIRCGEVVKIGNSQNPSLPCKRSGTSDLTPDLYRVLPSVGDDPVLEEIPDAIPGPAIGHVRALGQRCCTGRYFRDCGRIEADSSPSLCRGV